MKSLFLGVLIGMLISSVGMSGLIRLSDNVINIFKTQTQDLAK